MTQKHDWRMTVAERRSLRPEFIDANQLYSLAEAMAALDCSRANLYRAEKAGQLRVIREGRRVKVHGRELIRLTNQLAESAGNAA